MPIYLRFLAALELIHPSPNRNRIVALNLYDALTYKITKEMPLHMEIIQNV